MSSHARKRHHDITARTDAQRSTHRRSRLYTHHSTTSFTTLLRHRNNQLRAQSAGRGGLGAQVRAGLALCMHPDGGTVRLSPFCSLFFFFFLSFSPLSSTFSVLLSLSFLLSSPRLFSLFLALSPLSSCFTHLAALFVSAIFLSSHLLASTALHPNSRWQRCWQALALLSCIFFFRIQVAVPISSLLFSYILPSPLLGLGMQNVCTSVLSNAMARYYETTADPTPFESATWEVRTANHSVGCVVMRAADVSV